MTKHDPFKTGNIASDGIDLLLAWNHLTFLLPPKHHVLISGPWADGHLSVSVVNQERQPSETVVTVRGSSLTQALVFAADSLDTGLTLEKAEMEKAAVSKTATTGRSKRTTANKAATAPVKITADAVDKLLHERSSMVGVKPGFTRDRDLVAYLVYKNGRVSQYELRHQYGIKNPAQAINEAEMHHKFTMQTGEALPNGDIPYRLIGAAPAIEGTMPMFATGVEDPDEKLYVLELDLYACAECGRHPVYRPQRIEGAYAGVCPRHGPATFARI